LREAADRLPEQARVFWAPAGLRDQRELLRLRMFLSGLRTQVKNRIPACIVVLDKEDAHARKGIFMIDASTGFTKDGPKNRLRSQDLHKIVDVFNKKLEVPKYSRT
jgi:N-6 DNA Methylase